MGSSEAYPPPNFDWMWGSKLAVFGLPSKPSEIRWLQYQGINHIISLVSHPVPPVHAFPSILHSTIAIKNMCAPTITQIRKFVDLTEETIANGQAVGVHCLKGCGRTGTMLAAYMVYKEGMSADEAVATVRAFRPGSIETAAQEMSVITYEKSLREVAAEEEVSRPPPYFQWIIPEKMAAFAFPSQPQHIRWLLNNGVKHLVTLQARPDPPAAAFPEMQRTKIPIKEFHAPTVTQIEEFVKAVDETITTKDTGVGVHCTFGKGRTGTMIAAYFVFKEGLSAEAAIAKIRSIRRWTVETHEQEMAVKLYEEKLRSKDVGPGKKV